MKEAFPHGFIFAAVTGVSDDQVNYHFDWQGQPALSIGMAGLLDLKVRRQFVQQSEEALDEEG